MTLKTPTLAAVLAALSVPAMAQDWAAEHLRFSGFGTLGALQTDSDEGQYKRELQARGATRSATLKVDSNLGLQVDLKATPWLSATVQTLTTQRTTPDFSTRIEWAYLKATPTDGVQLRAGQLGLPNFMVSDSRRVGYANTTLRPADEVYGMDILNGGLRGVEGSWRLPVAGHSLTLTALGGTSVYRDVGVPDTPVKNLRGLNLVWDGDWYQVRIGRIQAKPDLAGLADLLAPLLRPGQQLSDETYTFNGLGLTAERDNLVVQAEVVQRRSSLIPGHIGGNAWYVLGGYRAGSWLPYLQLAKRTPLDSQSAFTFPQRTFSAGLRWDAFAKAALKLQIDRVTTDRTPGASFVTPLVDTPFGPAYAPVTRPVTAVGVAVDFVF